jgi:hypothetical protein
MRVGTAALPKSLPSDFAGESVGNRSCSRPRNSPLPCVPVAWTPHEKTRPPSDDAARAPKHRRVRRSARRHAGSPASPGRCETRMRDIRGAAIVLPTTWALPPRINPHPTDSSLLRRTNHEAVDLRSAAQRLLDLPDALEHRARRRRHLRSGPGRPVRRHAPPRRARGRQAEFGDGVHRPAFEAREGRPSPSRATAGGR